MNTEMAERIRTRTREEHVAGADFNCNLCGMEAKLMRIMKIHTRRKHGRRILIVKNVKLRQNKRGE